MGYLYYYIFSSYRGEIMKTMYLILSLSIFIIGCNKTVVQPIPKENGIKFITDKDIYHLNDLWLAKIINDTDSSLCFVACGNISFGIEKLSEDNWKEIKTITQPCPAIYLFYYMLLPNDTASVSGSTPKISEIISQAGTYKSDTCYSYQCHSEVGDTLYSNIFTVE